jgi:hypothetical protein
MNGSDTRITLMIALLLLANSAPAGQRVKRPMVIHSVTQLGLEIWTESDPLWETRIKLQRGRPIFVAEAPALAYPPAGMTWASLPELRFANDEIEAAARGAIHQAALNYGIRELQTIALAPASYGDLDGYEATFSGQASGAAVDVRVFCGHRVGKPAVVVQAFAPRGKLEHLGEHIRRSWTHLRYLD